MRTNDWEGRPSTFLSNSFNKDFDDITEVIKSLNPETIMEVGFGNNYLLLHLLNRLRIARYYGFDKTSTFVKRARIRFINLPSVKFRILNIENLKKLNLVTRKIKPDILILRHVIEHLPSWKSVLSCLNKLNIPDILISIHTEVCHVESWSMNDFKGKPNKVYTKTFINDGEMSNLLHNYSCEDILYQGLPHRLKHYKLIK